MRKIIFKLGKLEKTMILDETLASIYIDRLMKMVDVSMIEVDGVIIKRTKEV